MGAQGAQHEFEDHREDDTAREDPECFEGAVRYDAVVDLHREEGGGHREQVCHQRGDTHFRISGPTRTQWPLQPMLLLRPCEAARALVAPVAGFGENDGAVVQFGEFIERKLDFAVAVRTDCQRMVAAVFDHDQGAVVTQYEQRGQQVRGQCMGRALQNPRIQIGAPQGSRRQRERQSAALERHPVAEFGDADLAAELAREQT